MANRLSLPDDPDIASKVIDQQAMQYQRKLEAGVIGWFFGDVQNKPGNIAGFSVFFSFIALVIVYLSTAEDSPKGELYTLFGGIITLALGYLFGSHKK